MTELQQNAYRWATLSFTLVVVAFMFFMLGHLQYELDVANRKLTCIHNLLTKSDPSACDQDYIFN